ncbi:uncharacterized protein [Dysidea avara]|uniref:uncharacterized protein isoform X2 n=1 Tax=Dysidea avara TaxID=196820 RepID=UPI0033244A51
MIVHVECLHSGDETYDTINSSGKLYQNQVASGILDNKNNISLIMNTDDIPVFRSSKYSFWPIYLLINELPFRMRISKENRILAGLWYGTTKPDMGLFMKPLTEALKQLYYAGVTVTLPDKRTLLCRAILLCTTCDLPAKAMILNMTNFNGFYSWCYCLQPGTIDNSTATAAT